MDSTEKDGDKLSFINFRKSKKNQFINKSCCWINKVVKTKGSY